MTYRMLRVALAVAGTLFLLPVPATQAQTSTELATIRQQIQDLQSRKAEDERRIADREARLARAEAAARVQPAAAPVAASAPAPVRGTLSNAFNPAIGVILNGTYGQYDRKPDDY